MIYCLYQKVGFLGGTSGKETAGDIRDMGSIPGSGRSPGGGPGNPLQYSCLENPMDRGARQATVHGVAKSRTQLKALNTHACTWKACEANCMFQPWSQVSLFHNVTITFHPSIALKLRAGNVG